MKKILMTLLLVLTILYFLKVATELKGKEVFLYVLYFFVLVIGAIVAPIAAKKVFSAIKATIIVWRSKKQF